MLMPENSSRTKSPDSKVHGANMGPIWGGQVPGEPHVGPMNYLGQYCGFWLADTLHH